MEAIETFYNRLQRLHLFTGMSRDELRKIVSSVKMDFHKAKPNEKIVSRSERSGRMILLIDGDVKTIGESKDGSFSVTEFPSTPLIIQPETIFGLFQEFTRTFIATSTVSVISIDKEETQKLCNESLIFRLNLINSVSTSLQRKNITLWSTRPESLEQKIMRFFSDICLTPTGEKIIRIKMQHLADILHYNRIKVSQALNSMQDRGLLTFSRGRIMVKDMQKMLLNK